MLILYETENYVSSNKIIQVRYKLQETKNITELWRV